MAVFQPVFNNESSDTGKTTLNRWLFFDFIAILVGVIGGLSATLFQYSIDLIQEFFNDIVLPVITVQIYGVNIGNFLLPIMGGLLVGPITYYLCKDAKGNGISEIEKSVAMHRGIMQKRLGPLKLPSVCNYDRIRGFSRKRRTNGPDWKWICVIDFL